MWLCRTGAGLPCKSLQPSPLPSEDRELVQQHAKHVSCTVGLEYQKLFPLLDNEHQALA